jgi:hypothetical protein
MRKENGAQRDYGLEIAECGFQIRSGETTDPNSFHRFTPQSTIRIPKSEII